MVNHQVLSESWHLLFYFALSTQIINDGPDTPSRIIFNSYYSSCYPFPISSTPSPNPANTLPNSDFSQSLIPPEFIMQHFKRMQRQPVKSPGSTDEGTKDQRGQGTCSESLNVSVKKKASHSAIHHTFPLPCTIPSHPGSLVICATFTRPLPTNLETSTEVSISQHCTSASAHQCSLSPWPRIRP